MDVINEEEKQFLKTLSRGKRLFERTVARMDSNVIPGEKSVLMFEVSGVQSLSPTSFSISLPPR